MPDIQLLTKTHVSSSRKPATTRGWNIQVAPAVGLSRNPVRHTLAAITANAPETSQSVINLGLGDPTHYNLHPPPPAVISATRDALEGSTSNGYVAGMGKLSARQAISEYHERWDRVKYDVDSIVLTHGVGHALDLVFSVLFPPYSTSAPTNILIPRPGFPQYEALLANIGTEIRYYDCVEENNWEIDLASLENQCDENTRAILITNPNNPCGSNYTRTHLEAIVDVAERCKIPIIADEIYGHMTWTAPFFPLAKVSTSVPVLTLSGLSKRFLLPGWRFGWVMLHDPLGVAGAIKEGINTWGNRFFGPNSVVQAALPEILATGPEWFDEVMAKVETAANIVYDTVQDAPGLSCAMPEGALYVLVKIDLPSFPSIQSDVDFCTALYREEAVFLLPGMCFNAPGYVRVVIASPEPIMRDVSERLTRFCERHAVV